MKHLLITKFAVRFAPDNPRRRFEKEGWLDYRLELFKKYCLPSVLGQTDKEFDWWFAASPDFPGLTDEFAAQLRPYGRMLWIDGYWEEKQPEIGRVLKTYYHDEWVCSTRLDSDDMLHQDFMRQLKRHATQQTQFLSFTHGYMIKKDKALIRYYNVNPFVSYVEYANPIKSVYHVSHTAANRQQGVPFNTIFFPGWAQVDHGDNIKNHAHEKMPGFDEHAFPTSTIDGFPLCT